MQGLISRVVSPSKEIWQPCQLVSSEKCHVSNARKSECWSAFWQHLESTHSSAMLRFLTNLSWNHIQYNPVEWQLSKGETLPREKPVGEQDGSLHAELSVQGRNCCKRESFKEHSQCSLTGYTVVNLHQCCVLWNSTAYALTRGKDKETKNFTCTTIAQTGHTVWQPVHLLSHRLVSKSSEALLCSHVHFWY